MNPIKKLLKLFTKEVPKQEPKNIFPDDKHVINEAFTSGGVTYYAFDNTFNLPYQRGLQAIMVYEELRMKCDYELVKAFTDSIEKILSATKVGLPQFMELKRMNDIMRERLKWVVDTDLVYKLAAVVYFDASESPVKYDPVYAAKKIEKWKAEEGINDFFLRVPIQNLIPFLKGSGLNFQEYSQVQQELNKKHREIISLPLSGEGLKNSSDKQYPSSAKETHQKQQ